MGTGGYITQGSVVLFDGESILNEDGQKYAILHQYDQHDYLFALLFEKFVRSQRMENFSSFDCMQFDVMSGGLLGEWIMELPVLNNVTCCRACSAEPECTGFVISPPAQRCWLLRNVSQKQHGVDGSADLYCGI